MLRKIKTKKLSNMKTHINVKNTISMSNIPMGHNQIRISAESAILEFLRQILSCPITPQNNVLLKSTLFSAFTYFNWSILVIMSFPKRNSCNEILCLPKKKNNFSTPKLSQMIS